jgi:glyceraldehyde-3-phosphate dehydrogenase/erythrose-4-phosphate dehydrogenase
MAINIFMRIIHISNMFIGLIIGDTLELINDSILASESLRINLDLYTTEYDFCDSKINKIRNSSLTHRLLHSMINDSCSKYIGWDNNEFKYFQRDLAFEEGFEEKICSDHISCDCI